MRSQVGGSPRLKGDFRFIRGKSSTGGSSIHICKYHLTSACLMSVIAKMLGWMGMRQVQGSAELRRHRGRGLGSRWRARGVGEPRNKESVIRPEPRRCGLKAAPNFQGSKGAWLHGALVFRVEDSARAGSFQLSLLFSGHLRRVVPAIITLWRTSPQASTSLWFRAPPSMGKG